MDAEVGTGAVAGASAGSVDGAVLESTDTAFEVELEVGAFEPRGSFNNDTDRVFHSVYREITDGRNRMISRQYSSCNCRADVTEDASGSITLVDRIVSNSRVRYWARNGCSSTSLSASRLSG